MLQVRQQYVAALRLAAVRASWIPLLLQARSPRELFVQAGGGICYRPGSLLQRRVKFPRALRYAYVILSIRMHSIWSATLPARAQRGRPVHLFRQRGILSLPVGAFYLTTPQ